MGHNYEGIGSEIKRILLPVCISLNAKKNSVLKPMSDHFSGGTDGAEACPLEMQIAKHQIPGVILSTF
jgi:hypothetical protein